MVTLLSLRVKLIWILILPIGMASAQDRDTAYSAYTIGAEYHHEFLISGYVRVREWEFTGDKMRLSDLGVDHFPAMRLYLTKHLRKARTLTLAYDHYYISGKSVFDRDITYNGTIIDGRQGIDVSPTRYFRLTLAYRAWLSRQSGFQLGYVAGLVFDHIKFYLDGKLSPLSTKHEVYEGFGRQAFPYPALGIHASTDAGRGAQLQLEAMGTYIPQFKSFYREGGHIHLQYSLVESGIIYSRRISALTIRSGVQIHYMHLFQESAEDTNILDMCSAGPFIGVRYRL